MYVVVMYSLVTVNSKINGSYPQRCLLAHFEGTFNSKNKW